MYVVDDNKLAPVLSGFGLSSSGIRLTRLSSGLINSTWKVSGRGGDYILQELNISVFKQPEAIANNVAALEKFLSVRHPKYRFIASLRAKNGSYLFYDAEGGCYRLMPYVANSVTLEAVSTQQQAYEAAKQFGKFTALLSDFEISRLAPTIPDFHNLSLRYEQFREAVQHASKGRLTEAASAIEDAYRHRGIEETYRSIRDTGRIPLRVIHHDTKISNVLFDEDGLGICVIDLDTVMPGYFFSDVGDMMRTYLSPVNEEEKDFSKIQVRTEYFKAVVDGYLSEMGNVLTPEEKSLVTYSGKFLIYMQALRFLTDFLNNDVYYATSYPGQNLIRAKNQFQLLHMYIACEASFSPILEQREMP